jgi:L-2-hydroxyglutarate oxidase
VNHLIYPVPDPARPFLGVHLTRKLNGGFTVGPSAVLAGAREGYGRFSLNPRDLADSLSYPGFWRLIARNAGSAVDELSASLIKQRYLKKVQKYCTRIQIDDLAPYKSGVRAQAVSRAGQIIDDFLFVDTRHSLHVCNAPSPAATSAIPIAAHIADRLLAAP